MNTVIFICLSLLAYVILCGVANWFYIKYILRDKTKKQKHPNINHEYYKYRKNLKDGEEI